MQAPTRLYLATLLVAAGMALLALSGSATVLKQARRELQSRAVAHP